MMLVVKFILASLFLFNSVTALTQGSVGSTYMADPVTQVHRLASYASVLIDSANKITIQEILTNRIDNRFMPLLSFNHSVQPYTAYWIKIPIKATAEFRNWWLILLDSISDYHGQSCYVDVYFINEAGNLTRHERTGIFVPRSQKSVKGKAGISNVLFSAKPGESQTIYIKILNEFDIVAKKIPEPQLREPSIGLPAPLNGTMLSVLCAVALLFSVLSFFFYFFVREKAYLFFGFYTLLLSQHYLILHSDLPFIDFYIPEWPHWAVPFFNLLAMGSFIFFLWFGDAFINLRLLSKRTHDFLTWFLAIWGILIVTETIIMGFTHRFFFNPYILYAGLLVSLAFIIRVAFFKNILARFYVGGALWLILFTILGIFYEEGLPLSFNPWPVGQVGQLLIYAAGLAYKIRLNEKARVEAEHIREMGEIKSKFFANISHEFRTPLTLIQGPLNQIEETIQHKEGKATADVPVRHLKTMRRNTDRLLELVNQLLDLSKLDSGKMKLQVAQGDSLQLLKSLAASFESMAERKQIHYHSHFPEQSPMAFFDKDKLEKIFANLLGNAFKYTPEQGTVAVSVVIEDSRLRFEVADNGPGISKKELDKIFDRFYRVEETGDKGSGIGLALVKELVDLYRGQISVSSEPGKGSRFRVSLPLGKSAFKEDEFVYGKYEAEPVFINRSVDEAVETSNKTDQQSHLPLLLIVEDNTDLRQFISETVQQQYQVAEAKNGKEGLDKATILIPDVIISDVMMPEMDGFAMTERLKKDEKTSHIPVILLTAKAGQQHKIEGLETGADDYLTKPFDAKELLTRIANLVNQRKLLRKKFAGSIQLKPSEVSVKSVDEIFLSNTMKAIEKNMDEEEFGVEELAREVTMSRSQLHRKLIALIDKSPSDLIRQTRLLRAKELLQKKAFSPSEVAFKVGFNSHTYFSKCFKEEFGVSPSEV